MLKKVHPKNPKMTSFVLLINKKLLISLFSLSNLFVVSFFLSRRSSQKRRQSHREQRRLHKRWTCHLSGSRHKFMEVVMLVENRPVHRPSTIITLRKVNVITAATVAQPTKSYRQIISNTMASSTSISSNNSTRTSRMESISPHHRLHHNRHSIRHRRNISSWSPRTTTPMAMQC